MGQECGGNTGRFCKTVQTRPQGDFPQEQRRRTGYNGDLSGYGRRQG